MINNKKSWYSFILPGLPPAFWGIGIGIAKFLLTTYAINSVTLTYARIFFSSLFMFPIIIFLAHFSNNENSIKNVQHNIHLFMGKKVPVFEIALVVGLSLTGVIVNNFLLYYGLAFTLASDSSLILGLTPIFSIIFSNIVLKRSFQKNQVIGSIFGFFGISLIIGVDLFIFNFNRVFGDLIIILAISLWAFSFILSKKLTELGQKAIMITFLSILLGTLLTTPIFFLLENFAYIIHLLISNVPFILAILFFGLISSALGYTIWYTNIDKFGPIETAIYIDTIPFWTLLYSFLFLNEQITIFHLLGLGIIFSSVIIVNKTNSPMGRTKNRINTL